MNTLGDASIRKTSETESVAAIPRRRSDRRTRDRRARGSHPRAVDLIATDGQRWVPVAVHPHGLVDRGGAARPSTRLTSTMPDHPNDDSPGSVRSTPVISTRAGWQSRQERGVDPRVADPAQPAPSAADPDEREQRRRQRTSPRLRRGCRDREHGGRLRSRRAHAPKRLRRPRTSCAVQPATRRRARPAPTASPIHGRAHDRIDDHPRSAGPERRRGDRCHPAAHRDGRSDRHEVTDLVEGRGSDAADVLELVHGRERSVLVAVGDDGRRQHLTDAGKRLQLGRARGVDVDERAPARRRTARRLRIELA